MTIAPYPLTFTPLLLEKVWGGDRLARFGKAVTAGARVGESWELADMASTSASGAGGASARSVIANGPLKGKHLHEAIAMWGHRLLGACRPHSHGGVGEFPLLVKFLDARENLSVQVHPSPSYAAHHPGCHLKTECWYILDAEPGSLIYKGVRAGVNSEKFEAALTAGDGRGVVEMLEAVPAVVGECHNLPSGTVHALGAGVLVAEVQTPSDTTFRVYDWGRAGRELHVRQAMACIEFGRAPRATKMLAGQSHARLVTTEFFTLDEHHLAAGARGIMSEHDATGACSALIVVEGGGRLLHDAPGSAMPVVELKCGMTVLVPSACVQSVRIEAGAMGLRVLRAAVM